MGHKLRDLLAYPEALQKKISITKSDYLYFKKQEEVSENTSSNNSGDDSNSNSSSSDSDSDSSS